MIFYTTSWSFSASVIAKLGLRRAEITLLRSQVPTLWRYLQHPVCMFYPVCVSRSDIKLLTWWRPYFAGARLHGIGRKEHSSGASRRKRERLGTVSCIRVWILDGQKGRRVE